MTTEVFLRVFLATFFVMIAMIYSAKSAALTTRDGHNRVYSGAPRSAARLGRDVFNVFRWSIFGVVIARVVWPDLDAWLGPLTALQHPAIGLAGAGLIMIGAWIVLYAHNYMGALWRSGVPSRAVEDGSVEALLQTGPFQRTRNPIFLGVQVAQIGLFLAMPTIFTLLCLAVGVSVLHRQVRIEEADLRLRFGPSYLAYTARTPRWI